LVQDGAGTVRSATRRTAIGVHMVNEPQNRKIGESG
jgi:hypothetical protein